MLVLVAPYDNFGEGHHEDNMAFVLAFFQFVVLSMIILSTVLLLVVRLAYLTYIELYFVGAYILNTIIETLICFRVLQLCPICSMYRV